MDCLFNDNEASEMLIYAKELKAHNLSPMLYVAPDWDIANSSWAIEIAPPSSVNYNLDGYIGTYYGMPVYVFSGLDSHTCCVLPDYYKF